MRTARRLSSLLLVVLAAAAAFGQGRTADIPRVPGERIEVSIVNLDVVVTDKKGHRIIGLTKDDFRVTEDGKPQPITNFAEYRDEAQTAAGPADVKLNAAASVTPPRQRRAIVVFIDDLHLPDAKKDPVFAGLRKTLAELVRPGDSVMVVRWRSKLHIEQRYTSDVALLDAALDRASAQSRGIQRDMATEMRDQQSQVLQMIEEVAAALQVPAVIDPEDPLVMFDIRNAAQISLWDMQEKVKTMTALVTAMPSDARKAMIIVSSRLGRYAGGEYFFSTSAGPLSNQDRSRFDTGAMLHTLISAANAHNVSLYTLYPAGLDTEFDANPALRGDRAMRMAPTFGVRSYATLSNELDSLSMLAQETGGMMQWSATEIVKALPMIRDDLTSYYSLAYRAPAHRDNAQHRIKVTTTNPAHTVRARREYVDRSDAAEMHDRVTAALFDPIRPSPIRLELQLGAPVKQAKGGVWKVPVTVHIPVASLMTVNEGGTRKGAFGVYVATSRLIGVASDVSRETVPFHFDADPAPGAFFSYEFELLTDMLTQSVAVGVIDELSKESAFVRAPLPARARAE